MGNKGAFILMVPRFIQLDAVSHPPPPSEDSFESEEEEEDEVISMVEEGSFCSAWTFVGRSWPGRPTDFGNTMDVRLKHITML